MSRTQSTFNDTLFNVVCTVEILLCVNIRVSKTPSPETHTQLTQKTSSRGPTLGPHPTWRETRLKVTGKVKWPTTALSKGTSPSWLLGKRRVAGGPCRKVGIPRGCQGTVHRKDLVSVTLQMKEKKLEKIIIKINCVISIYKYPISNYKTTYICYIF